MEWGAVNLRSVKIMKRILLLLLLLFPAVAFSAPDSTMSIIPVAVSGTTITASDENSRNNVVSTTFNSHDHNDIDQTANTLNVGDAAAGNKTITAYNADASKPFIKYDDTADDWLFSIDGTNTTMGLSAQGLTFEGATANDFEMDLAIEEPTADRRILFPNASGTVVLVGNTLGATSGGTGQSTYAQGDILYSSATDTLSKLSAGTAGRILKTLGASANPVWADGQKFSTATFVMDSASNTNITITGAGFTPRSALIIAAQDALTSFSIGWVDASNSYAVWDQTNGADTTNNWGISTAACAILSQSGGSQTFTLNAFTSDGITLTNTKASSPSGAVAARFLVVFFP